jgi:cyclopropane fatty-acyl-phospholipid synthase-like methyltransferase
MAETSEWSVPERIEEFNRRYQMLGQAPFIAAERRATGCDYGASSYTTVDEADDLADRLDLGPGMRLLEVGAGAGWPGVYMAASRGCDLIVTDLAVEGLKIARARMSAEGVAGAAVAAGGERLPFRDRMFDAATSSDVFC